MAKLEVREETYPAKWELLGGGGLIAFFRNDEVPARFHPLGLENELIFAPVLLSGTSAPC